MTYEQALQIAIEELDDVVRKLRMDPWVDEKTIEAECNPLISARNVLCKKREWVYLTEEEMLDIVDTYGMQLADAIEAKLKEKNTPQEQSEVERLRQVCRNVYEVWAGSDGIPVPETCAEGYLLRLIEQMRDEAKAGL